MTYFALTDSRIMEISSAAGIAPTFVEAICLSQDRAEGEEHQSWLNTAPIPEIASWVATIWADNAETLI